MTKMAAKPINGKNLQNFYPEPKDKTWYVASRTHIRDMLFWIGGNITKSNRKAMNRNWGNQKPNPALKPKMGNK